MQSRELVDLHNIAAFNKEKAEFDTMTVDKLIGMIYKRKFGNKGAIFSSIADRLPVNEVAPIFIWVLKQVWRVKVESRYYCACSLLIVTKFTKWDAYELSTIKRKIILSNIKDLEAVCERRGYVEK